MEMKNAKTAVVTGGGTGVGKAVALALAGAGVALRSTWDVGDELRDGRLKAVLPQYAGSSDVAIFALTAGRARAETRVRAFIEFLSGLYGETPEWDR